MKFWKKKEYEKFLPKLEVLSRNQLAILSKKTGVIYDEPEKVSKQEYLLVLDETYPAELKREYDKLIKGIKSVQKPKKWSSVSKTKKIGVDRIEPGYGNKPAKIKIKILSRKKSAQ